MARSIFTKHERFAIDLAVRHAEHRTRFEFSVFVGACGWDSCEFARQLHACLVAPQRSVLVMVDPGRRVIEVVTGKLVAHALPDSTIFAVLDKARPTFVDGPLAAAVVHTVRSLGEAASGSVADPSPPDSDT